MGRRRDAAGLGRLAAAHRGDPDVVVLDIRSAIDGGGAEAFAEGAYPGRGAQRLRQGRLARDARRRAVQAAERRRAGKADRRTRHRRGQPRGGGAGRRARHGFRRRGARLLDAEGRGRRAGLDPRRRLRGMDRGARQSGRDAGRASRRRRSSPRRIDKAADRRTRATSSTIERNRRRDAGRCAAGDVLPRQATRRPPRLALRPHSGRAINLDSATFYDPATNRLRPPPSSPAIAAQVPAGAAITYCNTGPLGGDRLVRAVGTPRPQGRAALLRLDGRRGPPTRAGRLRRRAPSGTTSRRRSASARSSVKTDVVSTTLTEGAIAPHRRRPRDRLAVPRSRRVATTAVLVALVLLDGEPRSARADRCGLRARRRVPQDRIQLHGLVAALPDARRGRRPARRPAADRGRGTRHRAGGGARARLRRRDRADRPVARHRRLRVRHRHAARQRLRLGHALHRRRRLRPHADRARAASSSAA